MTKWRPLSKRNQAGSQEDALHEGVPAWLKSSLLSWAKEVIGDPGSTRGQVQGVEGQLRGIERMCRVQLNWRATRYYRFPVNAALADLLAQMSADETLCLDVIDLLLQDAEPVEGVPLNRMLEEAGSAWQVQRGGTRGLMKRVDETVQAAAERLIGTGQRASDYLAKAWHEAFGRSPHPDSAYRDAVRAVEAAAIPIVIPNDKDATLGKVIGEIRTNPGPFQLVLQPSGGILAADVLRDMLQLLWKSQFDRHGTPDDSVPLSVSQQEAEAAVVLAVTLIQWFTSGAVKRI